MKINYFKTFDELDGYMKDVLKNIDTSQRKTLRSVWIHLRKKIRDAHGVSWPWWLKSKSSPNTPLLKTWKLRGAVSFRTSSDTVEVYSKMEWLALIHEYGAVYKMTDKQRRFLFANVFKKQSRKWRPRKNWGSGLVRIPPRPIWRRVIANEENNIYEIAKIHYSSIFK